MQYKDKFITFYRRLKALLFPVRASTLPYRLQKNFRNLYFDIAWFGVLNGSAISFLTIFAARLGANTGQIGLVNATPAMISLILALPVGSWLENRKLDKTVFYSAILQRLFYLAIASLPLFLLSQQTQIWLLILITLVMSIPGAVIAVGFNVLFAASVPPQYRGMVAGRRNAVFAITTVITSLVCGQILNNMPFPSGYQVIFTIGFLGGLMSSIHLWFVKPITTTGKSMVSTTSLKNKPGFIKSLTARFHPEVLKGKFGKTLFLLTLYHLFHFLTVPVYPIYTVNNLALSDQTISLGNALFHLTMFIGSAILGKLTSRFGNHKVTAYGMCILGLFPIILSLANGAFLFMVSLIIAGFAWALVGSAMINYLLDNIPPENNTGYLAWFTLGTNAAILLGNAAGPVIGAWLGLPVALFLFGLLRSTAGYIILRRG